MLHVPHIKKICISLLIFSCQFGKYCWTAKTPIKNKHFMGNKAKSEPAFVTGVLVYAGNPISWNVDREVH